MEDYTTSGLRSLNQQTWLCGRVSPGRERIFERRLRQLQIPAYFPVHTREIKRQVYEYVIKDYKPKTYSREMPLFPGYVFVALNPGDWALVRERVAQRPLWLKVDGRPAQFPREFIAELQGQEHNGFIKLVAEKFKIGDELEITGGAFVNWKGVLDSDPDRRMLTLKILAETYSLEPQKVLKRVDVPRELVRLAS